MHNIELYFVRKLTSLRIIIDKKFVLKQTQGFNCTCISEISFEILVEILTSINLPPDSHDKCIQIASRTNKTGK